MESDLRSRFLNLFTNKTFDVRSDPNSLSVSCLCAYDFFAGRVVRRLAGRRLPWPYRPLVLPLAHKLSSTLGRVDYTRVRIHDGQVEPVATSGASILSSTTRAHGFVVVGADLEGYPAGTPVTFWLYDQESDLGWPDSSPARPIDS
jgi:molybdopterin biosynthesis enzyme